MNIQIQIARVLPWKREILHATQHAGLYLEDPFRVAALGLRESGFGYAPGYHPKGTHIGWGDDPDGPAGPREPYAFGFFQFDRRYWGDWIASDEAETVQGQANAACRLLSDNRRWFRKAISDTYVLERATYAGYNASRRRVLRVTLEGGDPDAVTSHKNYSRWIFDKADELRQAAPLLFSGA